MQEFYRIKKHYDKKGSNIICRLCPNECKIPEGRKGLCSVRANIKGLFYSTAYGRPCSINIDPVEKKPLYHYMPGSRILSIGTPGCNLFCRGCQNHNISRSEIILDKELIMPEQVVEMAVSSGIKMIAYTYNEPTVFFEYMTDIAKFARKRGLRNVIVSNGYINKAPLKELLKHIDAANIDLKGFNEGFYKDYAHARLEKVLETLMTIVRHNKGAKNKVWLELTNLIIPGMNDNMEDIGKMCIWIKENLGSNVPLHFSRFFPYYKARDIAITPENALIKARDAALQSGIKYVYIGNIGRIEDTYCSNCNKTLISRSFNIDTEGLTGKKHNECSKCRKILAGVFK